MSKQLDQTVSLLSDSKTHQKVAGEENATMSENSQDNVAESEQHSEKQKKGSGISLAYITEKIDIEGIEKEFESIFNN